MRGEERRRRERGGGGVSTSTSTSTSTTSSTRNTTESPQSTQTQKNKVPKHISKKCMQKNGVGSGVLGCYSTMAVALWVAQK